MATRKTGGTFSMKTIAKLITVAVTLGLAFAVTTAASLAASPFEGTWKVADTSGEAFEITLASDGTAKANRSGEGMSGTWKEDGSAATITWDTGWTTMISKTGEKYTKTAFKKGETKEGKAANTSAAEKVK
jgi:hypothetical protein